MPYVMVPVPEEHVLDVMGYVMRLAARTPSEEPQAWDQPGVDRLLAEANEPTRSLLSFFADRSRAGVPTRPKDVAEALQLDLNDVAGIVGPLNRQLRRANRTPLIE